MDNMHGDKFSTPYQVLYIIAALTIAIAGMRASISILVPM